MERGKNLKNNRENIWKNGNDCLIFAPAFEREGARGKRSNEGREKKFEKKLEKIWRLKKQALPLQPLSRGGAGRDDREREKMKEEFFKILR